MAQRYPVRGSFDTQAMASRSIRSRKGSANTVSSADAETKESEHSTASEEMHQEEMLEILQQHDKHLFFNLLSIGNSPQYKCMCPMMQQSMDMNKNRIFGINIFLNRARTMSLYGSHYNPQNLAKRIMAGQQHQEKMRHQTAKDESRLLPQQGKEGGALLDIGALEDCTAEEIRNRIIDFFSSDAAQWLPLDTRKEIISAFREAKISSMVREQKKVAHKEAQKKAQEKAVERLATLYHHVIISRVRDTKRAGKVNEYSITYILGFVPAIEMSQPQAHRHAQPTTEGIYRPVMAYQRIYYSSALTSDHGNYSVFSRPTPHFEKKLLSSTALDMGRFDEFGPKQAPKLILEYLKRTVGNKEGTDAR